MLSPAERSLIHALRVFSLAIAAACDLELAADDADSTVPTAKQVANAAYAGAFSPCGYIRTSPE